MSENKRFKTPNYMACRSEDKDFVVLAESTSRSTPPGGTHVEIKGDVVVALNVTTTSNVVHHTNNVETHIRVIGEISQNAVDWMIDKSGVSLMTAFKDELTSSQTLFPAGNFDSRVFPESRTIICSLDDTCLGSMRQKDADTVEFHQVGQGILNAMRVLPIGESGKNDGGFGGTYGVGFKQTCANLMSPKIDGHLRITGTVPRDMSPRLMKRGNNGRLEAVYAFEWETGKSEEQTEMGGRMAVIVSRPLTEDEFWDRARIAGVRVRDSKAHLFHSLTLPCGPDVPENHLFACLLKSNYMLRSCRTPDVDQLLVAHDEMDIPHAYGHQLLLMIGMLPENVSEGPTVRKGAIYVNGQFHSFTSDTVRSSTEFDVVLISDYEKFQTLFTGSDRSTSHQAGEIVSECVQNLRKGVLTLPSYTNYFCEDGMVVDLRESGCEKTTHIAEYQEIQTSRLYSLIDTFSTMSPQAAESVLSVLRFDETGTIFFRFPTDFDRREEVSHVDLQLRASVVKCCSISRGNEAVDVTETPNAHFALELAQWLNTTLKTHDESKRLDLVRSFAQRQQAREFDCPNDLFRSYVAHLLTLSARRKREIEQDEPISLTTAGYEAILKRVREGSGENEDEQEMSASNMRDIRNHIDDQLKKVRELILKQGPTWKLPEPPDPDEWRRKFVSWVLKGSCELTSGRSEAKAGCTLRWPQEGIGEHHKCVQVKELWEQLRHVLHVSICVRGSSPGPVLMSVPSWLCCDCCYGHCQDCSGVFVSPSALDFESVDKHSPRAMLPLVALNKNYASMNPLKVLESILSHVRWGPLGHERTESSGSSEPWTASIPDVKAYVNTFNHINSLPVSFLFPCSKEQLMVANTRSMVYDTHKTSLLSIANGSTWRAATIDALNMEDFEKAMRKLIRKGYIGSDDMKQLNKRETTSDPPCGSGSMEAKRARTECEKDNMTVITHVACKYV